MDHGTDQLFTATPDAGFEVDQWLLDGSPVQTGGTPYTLTNITADHTVSVT
ncbi:MAG: InlB B-repeat-containing protein, partial [Planctomycetota bacterium]